MTTNHRFPFSAIIFDMDGLLADTETVWQEAENAALQAHNVTVDPAFRSTLIGLRSDEFMRRIRDEYGIQASVDALNDEVTEYMLALIPRKARPMPGAVELVAAVAANGIPTAIASGSPAVVIDSVVSHLGWSEIFTIRCSADSVTHGKPAPDVYLHTARLLGVEPSVCLALEDSPTGARAAVAAGMTCFGIPDLSHTSMAAFSGITDWVFEDLHAVLRNLTGN